MQRVTRGSINSDEVEIGRPVYSRVNADYLMDLVIAIDDVVSAVSRLIKVKNRLIESANAANERERIA